MKSIILVFLSVFICSGSLLSQSAGIRAGANIANLTGDIEDNTSVIGWQLGPYVNFGLAESTDLNLAVLYSKKGTKDELTDITGGLKYLEIPLMLRFKLSPIFFQFGVYGSYLLDATADGQDVKDFFKDGDYGGSVGVGLTLGNITLDGRYSLGFANINDFDEDSVKNAVLTFGVEFGF